MICCESAVAYYATHDDLLSASNEIGVSLSSQWNGTYACESLHYIEKNVDILAIRRDNLIKVIHIGASGSVVYEFELARAPYIVKIQSDSKLVVISEQNSLFLIEQVSYNGTSTSSSMILSTQRRPTSLGMYKSEYYIVDGTRKLTRYGEVAGELKKSGEWTSSNCG